MQKIVLTGGSCAGKTSVFSNLKKIFPKEIIFIPEAATIIMSSGHFPYKEMPLEEQWQFQEAILLLQESMEKVFAILSTNTPIALCERGILDGVAYVPGGVESFCQHFNLDKVLIFNRYAAVIHLESVATGAPEVYSNLTNPFRYETLEEAQSHEYALRTVWQEHPHYHFVSCKNGIDGKVAYVKEFVEKLLKRG